MQSSSSVASQLKTEKFVNKLTRKYPSLPAMIGTALEYYDASLYWFMAPLIAHLFWPDAHPTLAVVYSLGIMSIAIISSPLGALVFGKIGDRFGRKNALIFSISGMMITTLLMAFMPTYTTVGILAPILLTCARTLQDFFSAGEYNGGAIYSLEHSSRKNSGTVSGIYCAFAVSGIFLASVASACITATSIDYWRTPYLLSIITALIGIYLRRFATETPEFIQLSQPAKNPLKKISLIQAIKTHKKHALCTMAIALFFSVIYTLPALFLNALVPMVSQLSHFESFSLNSISLLIYLVALICGGMLADKMGITRSMQLCTVITAILAVPLFRMLVDAPLMHVFIIKAILAILGGWFIGPIHAWFQQQFPSWCRYRLISLCYCIGSEIGGITPSLTLWLWHKHHNINIPGYILIASSFLCIIGLRFAKRITPTSDSQVNSAQQSASQHI